MNRKSLIVHIALLFTPFVGYAAAPTNFRQLTELFLKMLSGVSILLFSLSLLGLVWVLVLYFANSDSEEKRESIKGYLFWAVVGVTVLFSFWGIVNLIHASIFGGNWGIPFITPPA